jgi:hypothetical protein
MSLHALWWLVEVQPGLWLNGLAFFVALAGSWLLLATRLREQRALGRLVVGGELQSVEASGYAMDTPTQRINQFFYRFGGACLLSALLLSWLSSGL